MSPAAPEPTGLPTLACPGCGGQTRPGPGGRFDCGYCGGHYLAAGDPGVPTLTPQRHLGAATAFHAAQAWLRERDITPDPPPRPGAISLLFVPYWRYAALLSGWVLTRPPRETPPAPAPRGHGGAGHDDGDGAALAALLAHAGRRDEERRLAEFLAVPRAGASGPADGPADAAPGPRTSALLKAVAWSGPACDVREFGLVGVHQMVDEAQLVPFDFAAAERTGAVCQVHGSLAAVRRQAERAVLNQLAGNQRVLRRRASFVRERVSLVYYPLHVFKYATRGLRCRLVLDGVRGHVLAGTRPAATDDGAWRLLGGVSLWSCVWAASPTGGLGSLPLLWLLDARARDTLASPRALALRAQETLAPPRRVVESF
ncbi:MAG: hypothetical protein ACYDIE_08335 [Candidatus Krumholzibacteriia bacterium]